MADEYNAYPQSQADPFGQQPYQQQTDPFGQQPYSQPQTDPFGQPTQQSFQTSSYAQSQQGVQNDPYAQPQQAFQTDPYAQPTYQNDPYGQPGGYPPQGYPQTQGTGQIGAKSKMVAGLLAIFLGCLGVHKFYMGWTKEGVIMLVVSLVGGIITCGIAACVMGVIGIVEGIMYLTKDDMQFYQIYEVGGKTWF